MSICYLISFEVVNFWSNTLYRAPFTLMVALLELLFWDSEQQPHSIILDFLDILESSSFQMGFDFWKRKGRKKKKSQNLGNMVVDRTREMLFLDKNCSTSYGHWWNPCGEKRRQHSRHIPFKHCYKQCKTRPRNELVSDCFYKTTCFNVTDKIWLKGKNESIKALKNKIRIYILHIPEKSNLTLSNSKTDCV